MAKFSDSGCARARKRGGGQRVTQYHLACVHSYHLACVHSYHLACVHSYLSLRLG